MSPPSLLIVLPMEGRPRVLTDALTEGEEDRLLAWIERHTAYRELVDDALDLQEAA